MFKNILVPFDGSPIAEGALRLGIGLAARNHAKLTLLFVLNVYTAASEMQMASPALYHRHLDGLRRHGNEVLEQARVIAAGADVEARMVLRETAVRRAADAICEEATNGYDVVIMGTHGRRGFSRLVLGSDAESVARACPIPVLLVPGASATTGSATGVELAPSVAAPKTAEPELGESVPLLLPPPRMDGGMPLLSALTLRRSTRASGSTRAWTPASLVRTSICSAPRRVWARCFVARWTRRCWPEHFGCPKASS